MKKLKQTHIVPSYIPCALKLKPLFTLLPFIFFATACKKSGSMQPPVTGSYDMELVADNLVSPLSVASPDDQSDRLFIIDQVGKVWIVDAQGNKLPEPFIDITSKLVSLNGNYDERGLLSMAFHPNYATNGKFYLFYTANPAPGGPSQGSSWNNTTVIAEFTATPSANTVSTATEKIIFQANHPQGNHNGGTIAFGPDGYLYISIGDGGAADDNAPGHVSDWYDVNAGGNGQDIKENLLGNILRIDVDTQEDGKNYGIPADNPFVGKDGRDEIYAFGFRNPYRFSFDMGGDQGLYAGDAGQSLYEEIDVVRKGGNYGWNVKEGRHCFSTDNNKEIRPDCPQSDPDGNPLIDPVIEIANTANPAGGSAITVVGGNVYRGSSITTLVGKYVFGILSEGFNPPTGKLFVATPSTSNDWDFEPMNLKSFPDNLGQYVKGFGNDASGEVYVATSGQIGPMGTSGKIYRIVFIPDQ